MFRTFALQEETMLTGRRLSLESLQGGQTSSLRSLPRSLRRSLFRPLAPIKPKACCMHTQEGEMGLGCCAVFPSTLVPPVYRPRLSPLLYSVPPPTTPHFAALHTEYRESTDRKIIETSQFMSLYMYMYTLRARKHAGRRKARTTHKYPINTVEGKREIIRAPLNLRYTLEKDELNLANAAGFLVAKKSNGECAVRAGYSALCNNANSVSGSDNAQGRNVDYGEFDGIGMSINP
ncbi:hypothetical protein EAG_14482 [Camponotus floridanus]|uniref:Uncharacterized protein n=1 Tax=Camponotus floridanus TaxID=104421 RepID=E2APT8_CAMFO|nr:hypothetical protein EAG_14482 [Camponotus floridanus]